MTLKSAIVLTLALALQARSAAAQCPDGSRPPCNLVPRAPTASVAVLYFDNASPDTSDAYLASGLTEEIITRLGRLERLAVKSQASVRAYRGRTVDPAALGRSLGVAHLVNGSLRRADGRVRVSVELVRAATGDRVWGERYDRPDTGLLLLEADIASAVATAVAGRLLPTERATLSSRTTRNAASYDHFLRGNYHLAQRNPRATLRAIQEYEAAIARDPQFTRALGRIAFAYGLFHDWEWEYPGVAPESLLARGLAMNERALRQNAEDPDALAAQGYLLMHRNPRTLEGARTAMERALALDPRNAEGLDRYGWLLTLTGDAAGAEAAFQRSLAVEPGRASIMYQLARLSQAAGRLPEALRWLDSAIVTDPASYFAYGQRGQVRLLLGDVAGARRDAERTIDLSPPDYRPYRIRSEMLLARADLQSGDTAAARERIRRLRAAHPLPRPTVLEGWYLGMALVALGEHEEALGLLESVEPRGAKLWFGLRMPEFDALRAYPRFQRLMAEAKPPATGR